MHQRERARDREASCMEPAASTVSNTRLKLAGVSSESAAEHASWTRAAPPLWSSAPTSTASCPHSNRILESVTCPGFLRFFYARENNRRQGALQRQFFLAAQGHESLGYANHLPTCVLDVLFPSTSSFPCLYLLLRLLLIWSLNCELETCTQWTYLSHIARKSRIIF